MVIKIEINGLIDAARIVAGAIIGLGERISREIAARQIPNEITFREHEKPGNLGEPISVTPTTRKKRGPRTGYVRIDNLARRIAEKHGVESAKAREYLRANFGDKLVRFDNGQHVGFPKETANAILYLTTSVK